MSFILDALKKSENERQRTIGPSLADIPLRRAKNDRPWWALAVAALLVVNLGVLIVVLWRDRDAPDTQAAAATPQVQTQAAPAPQQHAPRPQPMSAVVGPAPERTNPAVHSLADEAGVPGEGYASEVPFEPSVGGAAAVPEGPPVVRPITPPTVTALPNQATFAAQSRTAPDRNPSAASVHGGLPLVTGAQERPPEPSNEMLPTNSSLIAGGTSLPDMKLDIHVYSSKPAERFVFVNMRKYVEGQTLSEGPMLERITQDGAILNQNGLRFLLPRQ